MFADLNRPMLEANRGAETLGFVKMLPLAQHWEGLDADAPSLPRVRVKQQLRQETRIVCAFCKNDLMWRVNVHELDKREVVPICTTCQRRTAEDPNYLRDSFDAYLAVELELIDGEGDGDRIPCGILTLVTDD